MQSRFSLFLGLSEILLLASIANCNLLKVSNGQTARSLAPRQVPGVISSSDFLRRAGHASVVAGDWVYIDGGEFSFLNDGNPNYQYSSTILSIDLSQTWSNSTVTIHSTFKLDGVPQLIYPSLWYDEQEDVLYSGFAGRVSSFGDKPSPYPLSLWSFKPDGTGSGNWSEVVDSGAPAWDSITRPVQPMMAFGSGNAYVLGGVENSQSAPSAVDLQENVALPGLVHFNMTTKTFSNSTASGYSFNGTAEKGIMHYVPSFGPDGLFIVMGGDDCWHLDSGSVRDLETISIFDPSSNEWFNQTTTGNVPQPRKEFCLAGIDSNNATHEIFMYAGWDGRLGVASVPYDEIYILTLPAFHWIKVDYPPQHPRHSFTCNAVGGSQILTIGGLDTNSKHTNDDLAYTSPYDTTPDPFTQGLAIFDMTKLKFMTQYTANAAPYVQSDLVKGYYETSSAILYESRKLASLLDITRFANTTTSSPINPTSPSQPNSNAGSTRSAQSSSSNSSEGTPVGSIVGGIVGGVAALALFAALVLFLVRRRRKSPGIDDPIYVEAPNTPNRRLAPKELYQPPPEIEGKAWQKGGAELRGDDLHSPVELGGSLEMAELDGSHR